MSRAPVDLIVVPWDVDRRDTAAARAPRKLIHSRFPHELGANRNVREAGIPYLAIGPRTPLLSVSLIAGSIAHHVAASRARRRFPLILAGGCLAAIGVVAGLQKAGGDPAVLWVDAHGDFNNPGSSPSGYWDGMALATVCGVGLDLRDLVEDFHPLAVNRVLHLGGRAFDPLESENVRRHGLALVPADGLAGEETRERLHRLTATGGYYLHVDLDGLDPQDAPAVGFPVPDGVRLDDLLDALGELPPPEAMTFSALSFDRADAEATKRTVATCLRLADAFARF
ncbi:MAG: arginase family protein [Acidobacteria bacterium]|nr:arginase family protein [Acidobacteriota bacterium]